jgi:TrbC/VIRB2 family.
MIQKMKGVHANLSKHSNQAWAAVCALAVTVLVPGAAHAGDLTDAIKDGVNGIVTDLTSAVGVIVLIVLAVVGAKVVFGMLKRA